MKHVSERNRRNIWIGKFKWRISLKEISCELMFIPVSELDTFHRIYKKQNQSQGIR